MDTIVQIAGELNDVSLVRRLSTKVLDSPRLSRNLSLSHVKYPCQAASHARRLTSRIGDLGHIPRSHAGINDA